METETMGRVTVATTIENLGDVLLAEEGKLPHEEIRKIEVPDSLVDTGATTLAMPRDLIN